MLFTTLLTTAAAVLSSTVVAAPVEERAAEIYQIGPFALRIAAQHKTYNGKYVSGIHVGAGIDQAVPGGAPDKTFYINATDGGVAGKSPIGRLQYNVAPGIPFQGSLVVNTSSNIAALWLAVTEPEYSFGFDSAGRLTLDGVSNWWGCTTYTAYGPKAGINWKFGSGINSTPDCQPLEIYKA